MYFHNQSGLVLAEPSSHYQTSQSPQQWVEVLADCPGVEGLYTYRVRSDLTIKPGDILSVPFGASIVGAIAIRLCSSPPPDLEPEKIKEVEDVVSSGFFPHRYWQLLEKVAEYYCTELITVIRVALPPGLLGRSQRRIRLLPDAIPPGAETFCSRSAAQVLHLLEQQKSGDYSYRYLQKHIVGARRGIQELVKRGWAESYIESPKKARPQLIKVSLTKVTTLIN